MGGGEGWLLELGATLTTTRNSLYQIEVYASTHDLRQELELQTRAHPECPVQSRQNASLLLTATAMAGIGLSVSFAALRQRGVKAALVGAAGFAALSSVAALYVASAMW